MCRNENSKTSNMTYRYMCKIMCTQVNPNGAGAGAGAIGIQQLRSRSWSYILIEMCSRAGAGSGAASYLGLLRSPDFNKQYASVLKCSYHIQ